MPAPSVPNGDRWGGRFQTPIFSAPRGDSSTFFAPVTRSFLGQDRQFPLWNRVAWRRFQGQTVPAIGSQARTDSGPIPGRQMGVGPGCWISSCDVSALTNLPEGRHGAQSNRPGFESWPHSAGTLPQCLTSRQELGNGPDIEYKRTPGRPRDWYAGRRKTHLPEWNSAANSWGTEPSVPHIVAPPEMAVGNADNGKFASWTASYFRCFHSSEVEL